MLIRLGSGRLISKNSIALANFIVHQLPRVLEVLVQLASVEHAGQVAVALTQLLKSILMVDLEEADESTIFQQYILLDDLKISLRLRQ